MLIIGSEAMRRHGYDVVPNDLDFIMTFEEFKEWQKAHKSAIKYCVPTDGDHFHVVDVTGKNIEIEIAWPGSSGAMLLDRYVGDALYAVAAPLEVLLALKLSHRYKKDSVHFLKTMRDIQKLRADGVEVGDWLNTHWMAQRERETYDYAHPKLDVSKGEFFTGDGVRYVYDHDTIHKAVALIQVAEKDFTGTGTQWSPRPAYTYYMREGSEVMTSKEKFMGQRWEIRLYGVYEETCVLALERSQIPYDFAPDARWSFEKALMKVCTSITSGWFREWAWENYDKVLDLYAKLGENNYIERFKANAHLLKPYEGESHE